MVGELFKIQPASCRAPLPLRKIEHHELCLKNNPKSVERWERVLFFDPTEVYKRIGDIVDPYERIQAIAIHKIFPSIEGYCACGCGGELASYQKRWANHNCSQFAWDVRNIICNAHQMPGKYIARYVYPSDACCDGDNQSNIQLDHIVGVKHGGGGSWLSNYQYLCHDCHRKKTNKDFGWTAKPVSNQISMFKD